MLKQLNHNYNNRVGQKNTIYERIILPQKIPKHIIYYIYRVQ